MSEEEGASGEITQKCPPTKRPRKEIRRSWRFLSSNRYQGGRLGCLPIITHDSTRIRAAKRATKARKERTACEVSKMRTPLIRDSTYWLASERDSMVLIRPIRLDTRGSGSGNESCTDKSDDSRHSTGPDSALGLFFFFFIGRSSKATHLKPCCTFLPFTLPTLPL